MNTLTWKAVDIMKKCKDTVNSQLTTAEKTALVSALAQTGCTHIALSVPMDDNSVLTGAGNTPSPRTIEAETQDWCDVIHAQIGLDGTPLKVIHRGSFCGIENIYSVAYDKATALGTAASSASDANTTWCGRYYRYLYNHVGDHVITGDMFAPIPEGTTHAFDGNWFTTQSPYMSFFTQLHTITNTYAAAKGVTVSFMSHNNFSELASGYINTIFADQNIAGADYYGQRQGSKMVKPADYVRDWNQLYLGLDSNGGGGNNAGGVNQFWGEWGDLSSGMPSGKFSHLESHLNFLITFYKAIRDSVITPAGHMTGFNYWGGWEGQDTSILIKSGSGASATYSLNAMGKILAAFYRNSSGAVRTPVCTSGATDTVGGRTFTF